jgi:hypothetical protein
LKAPERHNRSVGSNPTLAAHPPKPSATDGNRKEVRISNPAQSPLDHQRFFLHARVPVRAYVISALASIGGAVLVVAWLTLRWHPIFGVLAVLVMTFGLAISVGTLLSQSRYQTTVIIERDTVTLINGRRRRVLNWIEVADVTTQGPYLVFNPKGDGRREVVLFDPRQTNTQLFSDLVASLRTRLDASRGYRP